MADTLNLKFGSTTPTKLMFGNMPETDEYVYPGGNEVWDAYYGNTLVWHKDKTVDNYLTEYRLGTLEDNIFTIENNTGIDKPVKIALDFTNFYDSSSNIDFKYNTEVYNISQYYTFETLRNVLLNYNPDLSYKWYKSNIGDIHTATNIEEYPINFSDVSDRFPDSDLNLRAMFMLSNIKAILFNTTVPITNMINFCSECSNLTTIEMTIANFTNVCSFSSAFRNCSSLINFNWNCDHEVRSFNNMFEDCTNLITILGSDTVFKGTEFTEMFLNCSALRTIVPTIDASDLNSLSSSYDPTYLTDIFSGCSSLQTFTIKFPQVGSSGGSWLYELDKSSTGGGNSPTTNMTKVQLGNLSSVTQTTMDNLISQLPTVYQCGLVIPSHITVTTSQIQTAGTNGWTLYKGSQQLT